MIKYKISKRALPGKTDVRRRVAFSYNLRTQVFGETPVPVRAGLMLGKASGSRPIVRRTLVDTTIRIRFIYVYSAGSSFLRERREKVHFFTQNQTRDTYTYMKLFLLLLLLLLYEDMNQ